jgi:hypothetical protein
MVCAIKISLYRGDCCNLEHCSSAKPQPKNVRRKSEFKYEAHEVKKNLTVEREGRTRCWDGFHICALADSGPSLLNSATQS